MGISGLKRTPILVLFILLGAAGVGTAFALMTITLAGNVVITDDLTVDSSTLVVDSANNRVGIGTTSPERKLDVRGTISSQATPGSNSNNIQIKRPGTVSSTSVEFVLSERNTNQDLWLYGFDGTTFKNFVGFDYPEGKVSFPATGNTLVIDEANNNVGIGTSSPAEELEVVGNIRATPIVGLWEPDGETSEAGFEEFVLFDSEKFGSNSVYFGFTAGNDHIVIKKAGTYLVTAKVLFSNGGPGDFGAAEVSRFNSADVFQDRICQMTEAMGGILVDSECTVWHKFNVNDRIKIEDIHLSTSILGSTGVYNTFLSVQRLN